jgi:hypothetical protein
VNLTKFLSRDANPLCKKRWWLVEREPEAPTKLAGGATGRFPAANLKLAGVFLEARIVNPVLTGAPVWLASMLVIYSISPCRNSQAKKCM